MNLPTDDSTPDRAAAGTSAPPEIRVAVVIDRHARPSPWEEWRFSLTEVLLDEGQWGNQPRCLRDDGQRASFLHPGFAVRLHRDEGEGYYLNLSSGAPVWLDRKSTRLNSSHSQQSRMPSSA